MILKHDAAPHPGASHHGRFPSLAWAWPTGDRDLLLRAAILTDLARATAAYQQWQSQFDFDSVPFWALRLLAGISTRIPRQMLGAKEQGRLAGSERNLWTTSRLALAAAEPALATLAAAGVEMMVLKGATSAVVDIRRLRGRYVGEVDLLVRPADYVRAIESLRAVGWRHQGSGQGVISQNLVLGARGQIDIHQCPCHQLAPSDRVPSALWGRASHGELLGYPVFLPSPTDRLLIAVAHGGIDGHAHSDWLVDCAQLIRGGAIDWTLFEALCTERHIETAAAIALSYLKSLDLVTPGDLLGKLEARARRRPLRLVAGLLEARPKREHSTVSALGRGAARASRLLREGLGVWMLERSTKWNARAR